MYQDDWDDMVHHAYSTGKKKQYQYVYEALDGKVTVGFVDAADLGIATAKVKAIFQENGWTGYIRSLCEYNH